MATNQMSIFDVSLNVLPIAELLKPGDSIDDRSLIGSEIPFHDLNSYINKTVIYFDGRDSYKVVKIVSFSEDVQTVYRLKDSSAIPDNFQYPDFVNELIRNYYMSPKYRDLYEEAYKSSTVLFSSDSRKRGGGESYLSSIAEHYCSNGRYAPLQCYPYSFFEINEVER